MNTNRREVLRGAAMGLGALCMPALPALLRSSLGAQETPSSPESVCPKSAPPAKTLWVLRFEGQKPETPEERLPLACLQGLVNRQEPRIYHVYDRFDELWLDWLRERGDVNEVRWVAPKEIYERFLPMVKGLVVIDPALPGSVNVATMLASLKDWLPVTPDSVKHFGGLRVAMDLRGKWKKNVDAYRWFYATHGSQMSRRLCASYDPAQFDLRDYFVEFRVPLVWVSHPNDVERSRTASPAEEAQLARDVFQKLPPNIPCMGWWAEGQGDEGGCGENGPYSGNNLASQYGKFQVCSAYDAGARGVGNLSVHSGTSATFRQKTVAPPPLENKIYYAFTRTDGDGLNFLRQIYRNLWGQPDHGKVPVGWQLGPTSYDTMPDIIDYYYRHATPNDLFVNALTGIGYIREAKYLEKLPEAEREAAWNQYMDLSARYFKLLDLSALTTFEVVGQQLSPDALARFTRLPGIKGIFRGYASYMEGTTAENAATEINGVPLFRGIPVDFSGGATEEAKRGLRELAPKRPAFVHISLSNWLVNMRATVEIEKSLGPDCVAVRPDQLAALYAEAKKR